MCCILSRRSRLLLLNCILNSFISKLAKGWRSFLKEPIAIVSIAYACLWLSVLSPHGVLLTGFLKDGWSFPEWGIGIFTGLGGLFGLIATISFPKISQSQGPEKTSRFFLGFQLIMVSFSLWCFFQGELPYQIAFLVFILFSRIGLYGFSLGEVQLRQLTIPQEVRGEFNGFASALTAIATLALYGGGTLLPATKDFKYLVSLSVAMVFLAFLLFEYWNTLHTRSNHNTQK